MSERLDVIKTCKLFIGGGFPRGACLATESAADGMGFGTHGSTYGGNPLGCAVGCAVMEAVLEDGFLAEVSRKAGAFRQKLEGLIAAHPDVYEGVRGEGLMLGLKCKAPNTDVVAAGYDAHLLVVPAADNVVLRKAHERDGAAFTLSRGDTQVLRVDPAGNATVLTDPLHASGAVKVGGTKRKNQSEREGELAIATDGRTNQKGKSETASGGQGCRRLHQKRAGAIRF